MSGRTYTVGEIIDRALRKADMYQSGYISADEAMDLFNESYAALYDLLVGKFENYYITEQNITLTAGVVDNALPTDFYKLVGADFKLGATNEYVTLRPFSEVERNSSIGTLTDVPAGTVRIRYVPLPTKYSDRATTVDGISGWETLVVIDMAIAMLSKEESSVTSLERQRARIEERIEIAAQNRDLTFAGTVNDIHKVDINRQFATLRYQLNGNQIRFISTQVVSPVWAGIY